MPCQAATRRRFLVLSATGAVIGTAGCLTTSDKFDFPDGVSEDRVQPNLVFGFGSPMNDLDSVEGDYYALDMDGDAEIIHESAFEINRVDRQYRRSANAPFMEQVESVDWYFANETLYERIRYEDRRDEYRQPGEIPVSLRDFTHGFRDLANLEIAEHWAEGVTFKLVEINENVEPKRAIYHANTQGMEGSPLIQRRVEQDGAFMDGEISFVIDEDGMLHSIWALAEFEHATRGNEIEYQGFDNVTVSEPDWVADARDAV